MNPRHSVAHAARGWQAQERLQWAAYHPATVDMDVKRGRQGTDRGGRQTMAAPCSRSSLAKVGGTVVRRCEQTSAVTLTIVVLTFWFFLGICLNCFPSAGGFRLRQGKCVAAVLQRVSFRANETVFLRNKALRAHVPERLCYFILGFPSLAFFYLSCFSNLGFELTLCPSPV